LPSPPERLRSDALAIWTAGVNAVRPERLIDDAVVGFPKEWRKAIASAPQVLVVGCGKAGAAMAAGLEAALPDAIDRMAGLVNVPEGATRPLKRLRLHPARPAGSNHPTQAGVDGADEMLRLLASAGPDDVAICLISGGGSALLPAPVEGLTLADKQAVTKQLHTCGATIGEMNAVRKHLSRVKGGRLTEAFRGRLMVSLIISDVVGDPLDVIASGPTAPDPTTFADALAVIDRYRLTPALPSAAIKLLERGRAGDIVDTPKLLPPNIHNLVVGNNATALAAAAGEAEVRGYAVLNLGPYIEGEAREVGVVVAGLARGIRDDGVPVRPPACVLIGG
jgi:glycerate 2-kinase